MVIGGRMKILDQIKGIGLIPVIKIENEENAVPLAKALCEGGLPAAEITFRTKCAANAIKRITDILPDMLVGAGTVLTTEQARQAKEAGAKFIVSPGLNPTVVQYCIDNNITVIPGCSTPTDIETALSLGLNTVKFFPAEAAGGVKMVKAMSAPYGNVTFMPTGGIDETNLNDYLSFDKVVACGGSFMVKDQLIQEQRFDEITSLTKKAVALMLGFKLAHIGINCADTATATTVANEFSDIFNTTQKDGDSSIFAGDGIEVMKGGYLGEKGHIAFSTNYIERAIYFLTNKGYSFNEQSKKFDSKGKLVAVYLEQEIGGFAVHLLQR